MGTVKSAQRTLEVLELFEKLRRPVRVSEIAKLLCYPQSSTSVLVNALPERVAKKWTPVFRVRRALIRRESEPVYRVQMIPSELDRL